MPTVLKKTTEVTAKKAARSKKVPVEKEVSPLVVLTAVLSGDSYGKVFNEAVNPSLLAQYVRVYRLNQRQGNAHTKTRGEVAGSGKKPWKQKGTGRSRVGSIRNPVWRHGGVSHGPVTKDWSLKMPDKMKKAAFRNALSQKVSHAGVFYTDTINLTEGRTKEVVNLLKGWKISGDVLIVSGEKNPRLLSGSSNLRAVEVVSCDNLNTYQLIGHKTIIFEKSALEKIKEKYAKN